MDFATEGAERGVQTDRRRSLSGAPPSRRPPTPPQTRHGADAINVATPVLDWGPRASGAYVPSAPIVRRIPSGSDAVTDVNIQDLSLTRTSVTYGSAAPESTMNPAASDELDGPHAERRMKRSNSLSRLKKYVKDKLGGPDTGPQMDIVHVTYENTHNQTTSQTHGSSLPHGGVPVREEPPQHIVLDSRKGKMSHIASAPGKDGLDHSPSLSSRHGAHDTPPGEKQKLKKSGSLSKLKGKIIKKKPKPLNENPVFGTNIEESPIFSEQDPHLPMFVEKSICYLLSEGLHVEGIFRISGSLAKISEWKAYTDRKFGRVNLYKINDPHVVSGLLKMYLRELPVSLIPPPSHSPLLEVVEECMQGPKEDSFAQSTLFVSTLQQEASKWSPCRLRVFLTLFYMLEKITNKSKENKMDPHNIGVVIGYILVDELIETMIIF